jgi:UPF0755 protein
VTPVKLFVIGCATLVVILSVSVTLIIVKSQGTGLPEGTVVDLRVPSGTTVSGIATQLDRASLIDHPRIFSAYVRLQGSESELKAGHYRLTAGTSYRAILETLRSGSVVTYPLTIPEGFTIREVAGRLAEFTGVPIDSVQMFLNDSTRAVEFGVPGPTLEGYVFPETYRFAEGLELHTILSTIVGRYHKFWGSAERDRAAAIGLNEREAVTLASIVEEEASVGSERAIIAGVYLNRLEIKMLLQADPTVQYALGEPKARLLYRDIDAVADHPYNTYTQPGLPPGPIASPGEASLRATLQPAEHDYLFFVAQTDGSHEFTRTIRDHNNAKNRIRREREAQR